MEGVSLRGGLLQAPWAGKRKRHFPGRPGSPSAGQCVGCSAWSDILSSPRHLHRMAQSRSGGERLLL